LCESVRKWKGAFNEAESPAGGVLQAARQPRRTGCLPEVPVVRVVCVRLVVLVVVPGRVVRPPHHQDARHRVQKHRLHPRSHFVRRRRPVRQTNNDKLVRTTQTHPPSLFGELISEGSSENLVLRREGD